MQNAERRTQNAWRFALIVGIGAMAHATAFGQTPYVPPSPWPDEGQGKTVYRKNIGQRMDTNGASCPEVSFTTEGSPIVIDARTKSRVSFTLPIADDDTATVDTLYRVDMGFRDGRERTPLAMNQVADFNNYYRGAASFTGVDGFQRLLYMSVWDSVDVHLSKGILGPRMAFVVRPGGSPDHIALTFTGQDSLGIDWQGALKLYIDDKWMKFEQAIAYQVEANGETTPLSWTAGYEHVDGTSYVKFNFDAFDDEKPLVFLVGYPPPLPQGGGGGEGNLSWSTTAGRDLGYLWSDFYLGADHLPDNDLIVTGATMDPFFPATPGVVPTPMLRDAFVSRYDYAPGDAENDAVLRWTTFIQGSGYDAPTCIKYAPLHDRIYVGGWSNSVIWPTIPQTDPLDGSFYQVARKGSADAFVTKLLPENGAVDRSTQYGGDGSDIITSITADSWDNVFFFGVTDSETGSYSSCASPAAGLPLCDPNTSNYQQDDNAGGLDMFVAKLDASFTLGWGSFIGGTGDDRVFDADYQPGASANYDRIAIVGSTSGSLPYTTAGNFQLNGAGGSGFLWLFNSNGRDGWGTHIHGITDLQAVSFAKDQVRVMGKTRDWLAADAISSCDAVPGSLSICGGSTTINFIGHYLGEFDLDGLDLVWSTIESGVTDASAPTAVDRYLLLTTLHDMYRFMDLKTNGDDDFVAMGIVAHVGEGVPCSYPTQPLWGMYHKPYDANQGNEQTEVVLTLYRHTHERIWCSTYGSSFPHIVSAPAGYEDWFFLSRGSDYGHDIVWVDGEVLYLVGTTGGYNFDFQCPYPGTSYCETTYAPLLDGADDFDGMIARFDLQNVTIGLREPDAIADQLVVSPSPASNQILIRAPTWSQAGCDAVILDATGRVVLKWRHQQNVPVDVTGLANGSYSVVLRARASLKSTTGRFIKL